MLKFHGVKSWQSNNPDFETYMDYEMYILYSSFADVIVN